jgi:aspartate/glutamate racemase
MSIAQMKPLELFSMYMQATGVPTLSHESDAPKSLRGKTIGVINGGSWIMLWSSYFGKKILPGVKIVNVGNEAVQLHFIQAHQKGQPCPPQLNIDMFARYADDLAKLYPLDAILISCSTMNRSADAVRQAIADRGIPVVQIDEAMMEAALEGGGRILVIATHGPTVKSTQSLLTETASRMGKSVSFLGATVEEAFDLLGKGDIEAHNEIIANVIREAKENHEIDSVVLAQLSMTVFKLSYPNDVASFGVPVFTSGETGFEKVKVILESAEKPR